MGHQRESLRVLVNRRKLVSVLSCAFVALVLTACDFEPSFDPPFSTVQTYVWAYNHNDEILMKECGYSADLCKQFRNKIDVDVGEPKYEKVTDIRATLLSKEWARPKATMKATNERALLTVLFTSDSNPIFKVKIKLLLVWSRRAFSQFGQPARWRLMPLEDANEEG